MNNTYNILVADDHQLFRSGFSQLIKNFDGFNVCHESQTGKDILDYIKLNDVDIITLDLGMPGFPDVTILRSIRAINTKVKILIVSMHDEISLIKQTIRQGADGYLTKESSAEEVHNALKILRDGHRYLAPQIAQQLAFSEDIKNSSGSLTDREIDILRMISIEGMSLVQIAERLNISPKTVTSHKGNIMIKLNVNSNLELIKIGQKVLD